MGIDEGLSNREINERLTLFMAGAEFKDLQLEGRRLVDAKDGLLDEQFWREPYRSAWHREDFSEWSARLFATAERAGVSGPAAQLAALQAEFDPDPFPIAAASPVVRFIAGASDQKFLKPFDYYVQLLALKNGLPYEVFFASHGSETRLVIPFGTYLGPPDPPPATARPPREIALKIGLHFPPAKPANVVQAMLRRARNVGRDVLRQLGYDVKFRTSASKKAGLAEKLRLDQEQLNRGEAGDIADSMAEAGGQEDILTGESMQKARKTVSRKRNRLKHRPERSR